MRMQVRGPPAPEQEVRGRTVRGRALDGGRHDNDGRSRKEWDGEATRGSACRPREQRLADGAELGGGTGGEKSCGGSKGRLKNI